MLNPARLAGLLLVAVVAMSFSSVSSSLAFSPNPLFRPASGQSANGTSGVSVFTFAGNTITCEKSSATGAITSSLLVGKVFVHYLGCSSRKGAELPCTVKSRGATEAGLILTKELHGILGLLLPSGQTGILFLPIVAPTFVELEEGEKGTGTQKCTFGSKVTGDVAGEISPVGVSQQTEKITFPAVALKSIDLTHGLGRRIVELEILSEAGALEQVEEVTYETGVPTEVT
jgi:hypothetical protein